MTKGQDPDGSKQLNQDMPRWNIGSDDLADLITYLKLAFLDGLKDQDSLKTYKVVHFTPFDPVHKRTEARVKDADGKTFKVTKGAPQVILALDLLRKCDRSR